jgi:ureidoglycolate lyase
MGESRLISPRRLTTEAFAPFGHVLTTPLQSGRWYHGDLIENRRPEAQLDLSFTSVEPAALPFPLRLFERHAYSAQAFVPLNVSRYLVTVCPDAGTDRPDPLRAVSFIAESDQTVVYAPGTWHHPMVALDRPGRFAIVMWTAGDAGDEELVPLDAPDALVVTDRDWPSD